MAFVGLSQGKTERHGSEEQRYFEANQALWKRHHSRINDTDQWDVLDYR